MPELPEVETIRQRLIKGFDKSPSILNQKISQAKVFWLGSLSEPDYPTFNALVPGQHVLDVQRRAKFLDILLDDCHIIVHLRMSGDI